MKLVSPCQRGTNVSVDVVAVPAPADAADIHTDIEAGGLKALFRT